MKMHPEVRELAELAKRLGIPNAVVEKWAAAVDARALPGIRRGFLAAAQRLRLTN